MLFEQVVLLSLRTDGQTQIATNPAVGGNGNIGNDLAYMNRTGFLVLGSIIQKKGLDALRPSAISLPLPLPREDSIRAGRTIWQLLVLSSASVGLQLELMWPLDFSGAGTEIYLSARQGICAVFDAVSRANAAKILLAN